MSDISSNTTTMVGTYALDGNVPVDPEIVVSHCQDTATLGQLVTMFDHNPDIRFFLVDTIDESHIDSSGDLYFLKDGGNYVLASNNTIIDVVFDNADFNPSGTENTFSLSHDDNGTWSIETDQPVDLAMLAPSDQLLVDINEEGIFVDQHVTDTHHDHDSFFIDPSVLQDGESEIIVNDFHVGSNVLELPDDLSIKDVIVDNDHDLTELVLSHNDATAHESDIIVKLMGVSLPDLPDQDFGLDAENSTDDLINHLIHSGQNIE